MSDALHALHAAFVAGESGRRAGIVAPTAAAGVRGQGAAPLAHEVEYLPWADGGESVALVPAHFGSVEVEYAALRRGCALLDGSARALARITGAGKPDFLQRMLTQDLRGLVDGGVRKSFWLNRKGRVDADLTLVALKDHWLMEGDALDLSAAVGALMRFVFSEGVSIELLPTWSRLSLAGPSVFEVLAAIGADASSLSAEASAGPLHIAGVPCAAWRSDWFGVPTLHLACEAAHAPTLWSALVSQVNLARGARRVQPCGWYAQNIARVEAGEPWFHIDFGRNSLPHETGVLRQRVSFTKGCYLGQEIVARMESLGKPKQIVAALRVQGDALPSAGEQVFALTESGGLAEEIGVVTSSTLSPMLGAASIALATMRTAHASAGALVAVNAEGRTATATVQPGLRFVEAAT